MDIKIFFNKVVNELDLGEIVEGPIQVSGGLTHRMFKLFTNKGKYIVKLLNPNIMKNSSSFDNCREAEKCEDELKKNNIKAIYYLIFNNKKLQEIDGQYFYIFEWFDGITLKDGEITEFHCQEMGKVLAAIHNIDLVNKKFSANKKSIDFKYYIDLSKDKNSPIYNLLFDKLDILNDSLNKGNEVINRMPEYCSICHNDMDPKNVLWINNDFRIIDLECLSYSNPYLELFELALCWSGYGKCDINFKLFNTFFKSYFENSKLNMNIDWESIYYANNGRLEWLEFNIKRSLMIDCDTEEEQNIGLNEVMETIEHVVYYDSVKEKILNNINTLIKEII